MTVSVIVPAFNAAHVLARTVPAVLSLTGVDEWIWVDDGSDDDTLDRLYELTSGHEQARVVRLDANCGRSVARNRGASEAQGDVLAFLDADARPRPGYIDAHCRALSAPEAVASVGTVVPAPTDAKDPYGIYLRTFARGPQRSSGPTPWKHFLSGALCIGADLFCSVDGFNEAIAYGEDSELACRLSVAHPGGLRAASGAVIDLFDTDTLDGVLAKARAFGASLHGIRTSCPTVLDALDLRRLDSSAVRRVLNTPTLARIATRAATSSSPTVVAYAVRYLLAHALYTGYTHDA